MSTATVRVTLTTRDVLRELAKRLDKSVQTVLEEAVEAYRDRLLASPRDRSESSRAAEELDLSKDPNVVAFESLSSEDVRRDAGKVAAFCHGKLVALSSSRTELFEILARDHPEEPCLVKELAPGPQRVVQFRRPRRIAKPESLGRTRPSTYAG